ncbi:MAG: DUF3048 domain-containing protein [Anaerolineales bacterium]|nr:DUF3048 domain-containing protein [Anaerolineales bacterium]
MREGSAILLQRGLPLVLTALATACNLGAGTAVESSATPFLPVESSPTSTPTEIPPQPTATPTETPIPLVYPVGPSGFPSNVNPLTGKIVADPDLLNRRPLAIKVSNFPRTARPQAGMSKADLLWEFYTEFGNTRWIAMFYGQDSDKVGPIRSARVLDTRIMPLYDAILVHVQAFETVWVEISKTGVDTINEFPASCPAICRDPEVKEVENSAFGNTAELTKYARRVGMLASGRPVLDGLVFDPAVPDGLNPAAGARIYFSSSATAQWKFDPDSGRYLRFSETAAGALEPLTDRTTGEQLAVDNLIILVVDIFPYVGKTGAGEQFDMSLSSSGPGYFYRDGVMLQGRWQSSGPSTPLQFVDSNGQLFPLHPGTSYIAILGDRSSGAAAANTEWWFTNRL